MSFSSKKVYRFQFYKIKYKSIRYLIEDAKLFNFACPQHRFIEESLSSKLRSRGFQAFYRRTPELPDP